MDKMNTNKQISTLFLTNDGKFSNAGNVQDLNNIIIHLYHIYKNSTPTHLCIIFSKYYVPTFTYTYLFLQLFMSKEYS